MISRDLLLRFADPRPVLGHLVWQIRSSLVAKINLLQLVFLIYWFVLMILIKFPQHSWSFILAGMSLIQALGLASKPQLSILYANKIMGLTQMTFALSIWIYAVYWSHAKAGRIDKFRVECMEVYPVHLAIRQQVLVLQSKVAGSIIAICQFCIITIFATRAKLDKSQDREVQYTKVEGEDHAV